MRKSVCLIMSSLFVFCLFSVASAESTLDIVMKRGKLIAGVRFDSPPMGFVDRNNQTTGFEVELVKAIAQKLKVGIELVQVTAKTRIPMLLNGNIDLFAASANHTQKRDEVIDYSITYYRTGSRLLVRRDSNIKEFSDLDGKILAVVQGSNDRAFYEKIYSKAKTECLTFQEKNQAVLAVKQNKAAAFSTDEVSQKGFVKNDPTIKIVGKYLYKSYFGIGVRENDSKWRDAINFTIIDLYKSGEFNKLYNKYFDSDVDFEIEDWPND